MKNELDTSRMTRRVHDIPDYVAAVLDENALWERCRARPPYRQNDYIGWITRRKREETRAKRRGAMPGELRAGSGYMGMEWRVK